MARVSIGRDAIAAISSINQILTQGIGTPKPSPSQRVQFHPPTTQHFRQQVYWGARSRGMRKETRSSTEPDTSLQSVLRRVSLNELNRVLYRTHEEEKEDVHGGGVYSIPRIGELPFCGLQGSAFSA